MAMRSCLSCVRRCSVVGSVITKMDKHHHHRRTIIQKSRNHYSIDGPAPGSRQRSKNTLSIISNYEEWREQPPSARGVDASGNMNDTLFEIRDDASVEIRALLTSMIVVVFRQASKYKSTNISLILAQYFFYHSQTKSCQHLNHPPALLASQ